MNSKCYLCKNENAKNIGCVEKLVFRTLERFVTKEEHMKINGQEVVDEDGYYSDIFDYAGNEEIYECSDCLEKMIRTAKRYALILSIITILLFGVGIANLMFSFADKIASAFVIFFGVLAGVMTIGTIDKSKRKNIDSSAIKDYILNKNDNVDFITYTTLGVGKEKEKFKPGDVLYVEKEDLQSFEKKDENTYVMKVPFSAQDYFNYDIWKEHNNIA